MFRSSLFPSLLLVLSSTHSSAKEMTDIEALASKPTRCTYEYAFEMYGAHCGGLRLSKIPSLRGGIEILDFSDNKLQEIHADTLSSYSSIKFLYLSENQIYSIHKDAFAYLTNLQTLDLSKNVILQLTDSIFQLPSLRKLYLNGNPLLHLSLSRLEISKPIKAPLELLDLSDCKITVLPDFGILPQLLLYNISHNPLITLDAQAFSSMCKLTKIDLTESIEKIKLCDLKMSVMWFQERKIYFQLADYSQLNSREFENCPKFNILDMFNASYNSCQNAYTEIQMRLSPMHKTNSPFSEQGGSRGGSKGPSISDSSLRTGLASLTQIDFVSFTNTREVSGTQIQNVSTSHRTWLTIAGGLFGFLVGFVLLLYIMHRHNVAQTKKTTKAIHSEPPSDVDKNATAILLNNAS